MRTFPRPGVAVPAPVAQSLQNAVTTQARATEQPHPFGQTLAGSPPGNLLLVPSRVP